MSIVDCILVWLTLFYNTVSILCENLTAYGFLILNTQFIQMIPYGCFTWCQSKAVADRMD